MKELEESFGTNVSDNHNWDSAKYWTIIYEIRRVGKLTSGLLEKVKKQRVEATK